MVETLTVTGVTIGIPVSDVEAAKDWYRAVFGGRQEFEPTPDVLELELFPDVWVQLLPRESATTGSCVLRIGVSDIAEQRSLLEGAGVAVTPIERVEGVVEFCDFTDPDGNRFSLVEVLEG